MGCRGSKATPVNVSLPLFCVCSPIAPDQGARGVAARLGVLCLAWLRPALFFVVVLQSTIDNS